jgi:hypothetical protein
MSGRVASIIVSAVSQTAELVPLQAITSPSTDGQSISQKVESGKQPLSVKLENVPLTSQKTNCDSVLRPLSSSPLIERHLPLARKTAPAHSSPGSAESAVCAVPDALPSSQGHDGVSKTRGDVDHRVVTSFTSAPSGPPVEEDFEDWWNPDLVVRQPAGPIRLVKPSWPVGTNTCPRGRVRVNHGDAYSFDGPLFHGRIMIWIQGLPIAEGCPDVFAGRRRRTWVTIQGRFKQAIPCSDVYTGQMFQHPIKNIPKHVMSAVTMIVQSFTRVVSSATIVEKTNSHTVVYPLVLGAQAVHAAKPGDEPSMDPRAEVEDVRCWVPELENASGPASEQERRAFFSKDENRQVSVVPVSA